MGGEIMENRKLSIVRVGKENYPKFCELIEWRRTGEKTADISQYDNDKQKEFFKEFNVLNSETFFIYAVKLNDEFIGYINAVLIPKPDPRLGMLYVDELWTAPPYRNHGVAKILMEKVFKLAKDLDLLRIRLYVGADNSVARNYYKKVGYRETSDARCCEIDVKDIL